MTNIRSIIRDMRSRLSWVVQNRFLPPAVVGVEDGLNQRCWANMPQELLTEVLVKIEASESAGPLRKNIVACAGVCRSWRHITKEFVKILELSGILIFPISVKQPGPRDSLIQCFIKRNRSTQTYYLYLSPTNGPAIAEDRKFLLAARKCIRACTDYIIYLHADEMSKRSSTYIGKLRSNFLRTKFTIFDGQPPHAVMVNSKQISPRVPAGNYRVARISYEYNGLLRSRGMHCTVDAIPSSAIEPGGVAPTLGNVDCSPSMPFLRSKSNHMETFSSGLLASQKDGVLVLKNEAPRNPSMPFLRSKSNHMETFSSGPLASQKDGVLVLKNKAPWWHEQLQCWFLNFLGRATVASKKNFQLVASPENGPSGPEQEKIILQFGKVEKDLFTMDFRYPISAFQAFAICLSSIDTDIGWGGTKIACDEISQRVLQLAQQLANMNI